MSETNNEEHINERLKEESAKLAKVSPIGVWLWKNMEEDSRPSIHPLPFEYQAENGYATVLYLNAELLKGFSFFEHGEKKLQLVFRGRTQEITAIDYFL